MYPESFADQNIKGVQSAQSGASGTLRLSGLDSLRAVAALWVFVAHLGKLPPGLPNFLNQIFGTLFSGVAAVMVFFVVSGLCIHLPSTDSRFKLNVAPYLVRRYVRVGIPTLATIGLTQFLFGTTAPLDSVLWTIYCEIFYYALYPALFRLAKTVGWEILLGLSLLAAVALASVPDDTGGYLWAYGWFTWVLGLPAWLFGVVIANRLLRSTWAPSRSQRALAWCSTWALSTASLISHYHGTFSYKFTMIAFSVVAAALVFVELRAAMLRPSVQTLEWIGTWSFSLYLCHKIAMAVVENYGSIDRSWSAYALAVMLGLSLSFLFYLLVEKPCHHLARRLAQAVPSRLLLPLA